MVVRSCMAVVPDMITGPQTASNESHTTQTHELSIM